MGHQLSSIGGAMGGEKRTLQIIHIIKHFPGDPYRAGLMDTDHAPATGAARTSDGLAWTSN
ncbi:hypothetical protein OG500_24250 [Kitasatospora sp. NBC_01250]|uniref:hypothetical protein n=1 Tax=unclassified Kitasatospora TaxID=2633591 RepID=UPI002E0DF3BA|nr:MULTISPECIES: hypothetical protein [unclassified Kitasatospora]WSJ69241.1 hypothetical protein OG294_25800 [Kitasatospora sp. NBC_01302]